MPKQEELALPRSIRVTDSDWESWRKCAAERGLSITAWLHMLASDEVNLDVYERARAALELWE